MIEPGSNVGILELDQGLQIWRARHPFWSKGDDYQQVVTSTYVKSGGETIIINPLVPFLDYIGLWEQLDKEPPAMVIITMQDHIRDLDMFVKRQGSKAFGPRFFFSNQVSYTEIMPLISEEKVRGNIILLYDGRERAETLIWVHERNT